MKSSTQLGLGIAIALGGALLVLEGGLRLQGRAVPQHSWQRGLMMADAERGWIGRPDAARWVVAGEYAVAVENGSEGYRRPFPVPPSDATRRVLVVGGSTAWGRGAGQGVRLRDWLQRERPTVAFVDRAVDGYGLAAIETTVDGALSQARFDDIVLLLSPADFGFRSGRGGEPAWWRAVETRSLAARLLAALVERLAGRWSTPAQEPASAPARLDAALEQIATRAERSGSRLVLVYGPTPVDLEDGAEPSSLREALSRAAAASGVTMLDLSEKFREPPYGRSPLFHAGSERWTHRAHFLAARALIESGALFPEPGWPRNAPRREIDPQHPDVVFEGRVDRGRSGRVDFDWPGVAIRLRVEADEVGFALRIEERWQFFDVVVDGRRRRVATLSPAEEAWVIVSGLGRGTHEVELRKRNGPAGIVSLLGIVLSEAGRTLPLPPPLERRIEVLGASVAAGHGNEGDSFGWRNGGREGRFCADTRRLTNAGSTYGFVLGRWFDARVHIVAQGGRGLLRGYGETEPRTEKAFPPILERSVAGRAGDWDGGGWRADVAVVNLGENDLAQEEGLSPQTFRDEYAAFMATLRETRPEALFLLLNDGDQEGLCEVVAEVVALRRAAGDPRIAALCYPDPARREKGCNRHPDVTYHVAIAELLAREVERTLGWERAAVP